VPPRFLQRCWGWSVTALITVKGSRKFIQIDYDGADRKGFIVNVVGTAANIYWACFQSVYLECVHEKGLDLLPKLGITPVEPCHTKPHDLADVTQHTEFFEHLTALIRCISEGYGDIGHFRRPGNIIQKQSLEFTELGEIPLPEYEAMEEEDEEYWRRERWSRLHPRRNV
jgi:hypothetical protein